MDRDEFPNVMTRAAELVPATLDEKNRTVEAIFTTGARVLRNSWEGKFHEELSLDPKHVRMERLQSGRAPLLDSHDTCSGTRAVIGVVESARLEPGRGVALVRFAKDDPNADRVWNLVRQSVIKNVSVGYQIHKTEKTEGTEDKVPVVRVVDWTPFEISAVQMGADAAAHFRALEAEHMENPIVETPKPITPPPANRAGAELETQAALTERQRIADVTIVVRTAKLADKLGAKVADEIAASLVSTGATVDEARKVVLDRLATWSDAIKTENHVRIEGGDPAGGDDFQRAAVDALLLRSGVRIANPHASAREVPAGIYDLARLSLARSGKAGSGRFGDANGPALLKRALTTSDLPLILAGALHAAVRNGYESEPSSHRAWVRAVPVADFRDQERPILGSAPALLPVNQGGEYTYGSLTDDKTSYRVSKYGVIVSLAWEVLVNDNLGAFLRLQPALGQAARRKEADLVYAMLAENSGAGPTMQDGTHLFHADHDNLSGSAAALSAEYLGTGRAMMRKQTAVGGGFLSIVPRFLVVPPELEMVAELLIANAARKTATEKTTPEWVSTLSLVCDPRLADGGVFLAAEPSQIDTVELGLLEENFNGPMIETEEGFGTDDRKWKVRHVCGAKVLDWRGLVKLPTT
ncbi:MAG TPA: prohead protease/major capsid protein fusion protein [Propionicimonas sp.]|jgi:phage head maturation protease